MAWCLGDDFNVNNHTISGVGILNITNFSWTGIIPGENLDLSDYATTGNFSTHTGNLNNPHSVTLFQLGGQSTGNYLVSNTDITVTSLNSITSTEIGYISGITDFIQTQLNTKIGSGLVRFSGIGINVNPGSNYGIKFDRLSNVNDEIYGLNNNIYSISGISYNYCVNNTSFISGNYAQILGANNTFSLFGKNSEGYGMINTLISNGISGNQTLYGILTTIEPHSGNVLTYGEYITSTATNINNPTVNQIGYYVAWNVGTSEDVNNKKWAFYNGSTSTIGGKVFLGNDNIKTYFGTSYDASLYYDGTNLIINPKEIGDGKVFISGNVVITGDLIVNSLNNISSTEISYLDNLTNNIQAQISGLTPTGSLGGHTGNLNNPHNITLFQLGGQSTGNYLVSNTDVTVNSLNSITTTEISYISGVTGYIQTQFNNITGSYVRKSEQSFTATIYKDVTWSGDIIPIWQVPKYTGVTLTQVNATVIGTGVCSLLFNIENRPWTGLSMLGTNIFTDVQTATTGGIEITSFALPSGYAKSHYVLVPSGNVPEVPRVDLITLMVSYTIDT